MLSKICSHMTCFPNEPAETKNTLQGAGSLSRHPALDMVGGKKHPGPWGDRALACCHPTFCLSWGVSKHPTTQPKSGQTSTLAAAQTRWELPIIPWAGINTHPHPAASSSSSHS